MTNEYMSTVADDPLPWLTERFREYGVYDPEASDLLRMSRILGVAQSTVNALSDGNKSYRVKFSSGAATAFTDGKSHEVVIGTAPALDPDLSDGQRAALLVAMAAHEVGHIRWSVTMQDRLQEHYADDPFKGAWASRVFNIAHDIHLEHWMREDFGILGDILDLKGLYFCTSWEFDPSRNVTRYGGLINATLYPHATDWSSPEAEAFKMWCDRWAVEAKKKSCRTIKPMIELIEEALAFLRYDSDPDIPDEEKDPTAEKPERPESEDEDEDEDWDEEEDEDGDEPDEGDDGDESDDESDDTNGSDDDTDDDTESDEDEDDDGDGTGSDEFDEDDDDFRKGEDGSGESPEDRDDDEGEKFEPSDEDGDEDDDEDDESDEPSGPAGPPESRDDSKVDRPEKTDQPESEQDYGEDDIEREHIDDGGETTDFTERPPVPTVHGDMHSADDAEWQEAIDSHMRSMTSDRDRWVVGGTGPFAKREMRVIRINR